MSESKTPLCGGGEEHDYWVNSFPHSWPCPLCCAIRDKQADPRTVRITELELALSELQAELDKQKHLTAQAENLAAQYKAERGEARDACERLRELTYVPGVWRCVKCKLELMASVLTIPSGSIHADNKPQECPNGCGPLWRVTERDQRKEAQMLHEKEFLRAEAAESRECEAYERAAKVCEEEICACCWDDDAQAAAEHLADKIRALADERRNET